MQIIYVTPRAGFKVPDPAQLHLPGQFLPEEGRSVEHSGYWARRIQDGDVTVGAPTPTENRSSKK